MADFKSHHVQLALAVGTSIIAIAVFSKFVLPKPVGYLSTAFPSFLAVIHEALMSRPRYKDSKITTTWYWVVAILVATAAVIVVHAI